jgi:hypothetical protein
MLLNKLKEVKTVNFSLEVDDIVPALGHVIQRANNYNNVEVQAQLLTELIQMLNSLLRPSHSSDFEVVANTRLKLMLINLLCHPDEMVHAYVVELLFLNGIWLYLLFVSM